MRDIPVQRVGQGDGRSGRAGRGAPAFSLVEVLIAVFVLSLGMLGLASIFPVVLRQQRTAGEVTEASIALGSIESVLRSNIELNRSGNQVGWGIFQDDLEWSEDGEWMIPGLFQGGEPEFPSRMAVDAATGRLRIYSENPDGPANIDPFGDDVIIPLSARLGPSPFVRGATPRVEWIIAARRIITQLDAQNDPLPTNQDELEVVVFVRPIDRAIQVPRRDRTNKSAWASLGRSLNLSDVLLAGEIAAGGGTPAIRASEARVPVALRGGNTASSGLPTGNGQGFYATPFVVPLKDYQFDDTDPGNTDNDRDRLQIDLTPANKATTLTTQVGQRLVDRRGNVYTVRGSTRVGQNVIVLIDPPVPASIVESLDVGALVASPIVPLAVEVFRVKP